MLIQIVMLPQIDTTTAQQGQEEQEPQQDRRLSLHVVTPLSQPGNPGAARYAGGDAAVWDADSATYAITRSSNLPENAYLDTYHEGDAIFLSVGYDTPGFAESGDLDDLAWLYITAEWTDTGVWVVTDVTDGFSFFADYDGGQYVVRDYWDEEVLQTISRDATLDTFDFVNPFAAEIGWTK